MCPDGRSTPLSTARHFIFLILSFFIPRLESKHVAAVVTLIDGLGFGHPSVGRLKGRQITLTRSHGHISVGMYKHMHSIPIHVRMDISMGMYKHMHSIPTNVMYYNTTIMYVGILTLVSVLHYHRHACMHTIIIKNACMRAYIHAGVYA